jgi:hypothetical protein
MPRSHGVEFSDTRRYSDGAAREVGATVIDLIYSLDDPDSDCRARYRSDMVKRYDSIQESGNFQYR